MHMSKPEVLLPAKPPEVVADDLATAFHLHRLWEQPDPAAYLATSGGNVRGVARFFPARVDAKLIEALPKLELIASSGVGYDTVDVAAAAARGVIVTNTPDAVTEETADTAVALLMMTVRELGAAERYLRSGLWSRNGDYRETEGTLRDRKVGIVGLGRIGSAIARRLDAARVPVVYHSRRAVPGSPYRYYDSLLAMAADVDTLVVVLPGGASTANLIDKPVLDALGPRGVVVNIGRGSTVDEVALIAALKNKTIHAAGLDVYAKPPHVAPELLELDNVVLLPYVGAGSRYTRQQMSKAVLDNLTAWFRDGKPLTPVPETPLKK
jgi:lactate dehydrogenase-like 2-hydroxyacid dehydrogenase